MALVAARPSIFGIATSMRMASKVPAGFAANASTACAPSPTIDTYAPSPSRIVAAISAFRSLSSTSSKRQPCRADPLAACSVSRGAGARSNGMEITNVDPSPSSLEISMEPPISSMSCLTMGMPKPVPPTVLATLDSRAKGSNTRFRNSGLMPMPVSVISQRSKTLPSGSSLEVTCVITLPPGRLYLMQLL